ncbi:MAG TPA: ABC transporter permease [Candidatus Acidoferrum sp.]|nr:ABC transporter permease [Candidatus Acidoferrum sp.]
MDKNSIILLVVVAALVGLRVGWRLWRKSQPKQTAFKKLRPLNPWQRKLYTVYVFAKLNTRRYFRDRVAIFFTVAFPLIFLFVFGGLFGGNNGVSFRIALINQSNSAFSKQFVGMANGEKVFKIDSSATSLDAAREKMNRGELDAAVILPKSFGEVKAGTTYPSGQAQVIYTNNSAQAAQTLASVLEAQFKSINGKLVRNIEPFTVETSQTNDKSLSQFDYTFSGLLGFSIIGLGIFGPINVFPELKKQGILRRFHTTPLRVWQYFLSTMASQAVIGLFAMGVLFVVALTVFHLQVVGNWWLLVLYLVMCIVTMLGIGLALGGWAKNERQVAPLANIIVFPMMFLSGTFFPRYLMPDWLQTISGFLPLTPMIDGIRLIATEGKTFLDLGPQLGLIAAWALVVYLIAFRVFRWE